MKTRTPADPEAASRSELPEVGLAHQRVGQQILGGVGEHDLPVWITYPRSAIDSAMFAFCSTTNTVRTEARGSVG